MTACNLTTAFTTSFGLLVEIDYRSLFRFVSKSSFRKLCVFSQKTPFSKRHSLKKLNKLMSRGGFSISTLCWKLNSPRDINFVEFFHPKAQQECNTLRENTPADSELGPPPHHPVPPFYYITASVAGRRPASGLSFLLRMSP